MSTETMVFAGIALLVVVVAGYFILKFLKGSIKLELLQTSFATGETIKGSFRMVAKQPIEGNKLYVALVAEEVTKRRDSDGKDITDTHEVYRDEQVLEGKAHYDKGFDNVHNFEITVPASGESSMESSSLGQALNALGTLMDSNRRRIDWTIEVCLDAKGIDLSDSEKIYIK